MNTTTTAPSHDELGLRRPVRLSVFESLVSEPLVPPSESCHPIILDLRPGEFEQFTDLCERERITRLDSFERQVYDLASARHPGAAQSKLDQFVGDLVSSAGDWNACGMWVFVPWENKAAHLLAEEDYFEVITNRNRTKITHLEQQLLRTKTIGVMGLSLGGEAAVSVAQEHLCGHIRIADFDCLDLSNLNRLNAGFDDLGVSKTAIAARRIAKIDPYIRVSVFEEGVTAENAATFLTGLDLLLEECDGLEVKFNIRLLAREMGLNILFAGDERGFLSVEPYGHDPELPVFHGLITGPQPPKESFPSSQAFLRELTKWLGGWEHISERTQDSLEHVGESLCGYPQLASEARYAAAQVGHFARRLLLGERLPAFIGHLDLDELTTPSNALPNAS